MGEKTCFITLGTIFAISVTLIILNFVWLFPVMNNSKKEEPPIELISSLIPNYNDLFLDSFNFQRKFVKKIYIVFPKIVHMKLLILK